MCGAFGLHHEIKSFGKAFNVDISDVEDFEPHKMVRPGTFLPIVTSAEPDHAQYGFWGFQVHWQKTNLINSKLETVDTLPTFKKSFEERRCIIFADGFYEWTGEKGHRKPILFTLKSLEPFAFAGIWKEIESLRGKVAGFSIITTTPNKVVKPIHDRMPVILSPEHTKQWLENGKVSKSSIDLVIAT